MDPVDLVPSGYRFVPTAEELVVDYLANWIAGTPLLAALCRLRRRLRHRAVESSRQRSAGGLFFCGAPAQGQRLLARRSNDRHRFLASEQKARTRQVHRRRARDRGGKKELPFLQGRPAEELRVGNV
ncbi:unnamed protein product [Musa acuminata subsp. burmannicoides]